MAVSAPSGPSVRSRSASSPAVTRASCALSAWVRCSQSRWIARGGVAENTRLMCPALTCTTSPCVRSTLAITLCRRASTRSSSPIDWPPPRPAPPKRAGAAPPTHHDAAGPPLRARPCGAAAAATQRRARGLHLGAELPVAADPGEIAAGSPEGARVLHRRLELGHLGVEPADAPEVLVLAEGGLH